MTKKIASSRNPGFSENDIRPDHLRSGMLAATKKDIKRLKSRQKDFVTVDCPACGSKDYKYKFKKYGINIVECKNCETFFTNPRPTPEILEWFYKDSASYDFWDKYVFPASEKIRREKIFAPRVDLMLDICSKFNVKKNSLLEVGAGHGTFCLEVKSRKVFRRVVAVEPVTTQALTCKERGIETINKPVEKVNFKKTDKFDVIVNFEVLEHLFSPSKFIKSCQRLLNKKGILIFTTPNGKGFDVNLMGAVSEVIEQEHLNYFNLRSIEILLKRSGMDAIDIITPGKLDAELVRKRVLSGDFKLSKDSFLQCILVEDWDKYGSSFQSFLANNKLSSHMLVVARNV